jgi:plastocyanin
VRKLLVPVLALAVTAGSASPGLGATRIRVGDNYFVRASGVPTVKVDKGTRVKWVFRGDSPHNVKVSSGPVSFGSSNKTSGSFARTMTKKGTYRIYCSVHGADDQSMKLVVR